MTAVNTTPTKLFAVEFDFDQGPTLSDFYPSLYASASCRSHAGKEPIFEVLVRAPRAGEKPTHWAWWEEDGILGEKTREFVHVWPTKDQVLMCFPYDIKEYEKKGQGKLMAVVAEKVRRVPETEVRRS